MTLVLSGIVWLACNANQSLIEEELLPLCWEELNHKYVERRLLISELCCTVSPYLSVSIETIKISYVLVRISPSFS